MRTQMSTLQQRLLVYAPTPQRPKGLDAIITSTPSVVLVEEVATLCDALTYCAAQPPDLVLVITDGERDILSEVQSLHHQHPRVGIVLISVGATPLRVAAAFAAGARGYMEEAGCANLPAVLRLVAEGGFGCCAASTSKLMQALTVSRSLSKRERLIAAHIAGGASNNEIALSLGIKPATVATHIERIQGKLGGRSRVDIATWWLSQEGKPTAGHSDLHGASTSVFAPPPEVHARSHGAS